jgi:hypothetical protein
MLQNRVCIGDECREVKVRYFSFSLTTTIWVLTVLLKVGEPSSMVSVAWSPIPTTPASATPAPAGLQGDTTLGNISKSDWTPEPSPILATEPSSSIANAGVVLAPRNILHCALLSGGIVTVLML